MCSFFNTREEKRPEIVPRSLFLHTKRRGALPCRWRARAATVAEATALVLISRWQSNRRQVYCFPSSAPEFPSHHVLSRLHWKYSDCVSSRRTCYGSRLGGQ